MLRHFLRRQLGLPTLALSGGVLARPASRALVLRAGSPPGFEPTDHATLAGAVDLAVVARRTHANLAAAARAEKVTKPLDGIFRIRISMRFLR